MVSITLEKNFSSQSCFRGIRKGVKPSDCLFLHLVPPSDHVHKQATNSPRPNGRELPVCLSSCTKFGGFDEEEQERESSNPQSMSNGENYVTHIFRFRLINACCKKVSRGRAAPMRSASRFIMLFLSVS